MNPKVDKIGIFVSIVATKVPFKGTGKEYIGDDIDEIRLAVTQAIRHCCLQLKVPDASIFRSPKKCLRD